MDPINIFHNQTKNTNKKKIVHSITRKSRNFITKKNSPALELSKHQTLQSTKPRSNHQLHQLGNKSSKAHHNSQDQCSGGLMNLKDFLQDNDAIARNEGQHNGQESQHGKNKNLAVLFDGRVFWSKSLGEKCQ